MNRILVAAASTPPTKEDLQNTVAHRQHAAQKTAGNGHQQAEGLDDRGDLGFGKTDIEIEDGRNHPQHDIRYPVEADQQQQQYGQLHAVAGEKILHRLYVGVVEHLAIDQPQRHQNAGTNQPGTKRNKEPGRLHQKSGNSVQRPEQLAERLLERRHKRPAVEKDQHENRSRAEKQREKTQILMGGIRYLLQLPHPGWVRGPPGR